SNRNDATIILLRLSGKNVGNNMERGSPTPAAIEYMRLNVKDYLPAAAAGVADPRSIHAR
ncbi:MAG: hypothetical protein K2K47_10480, partial [Duncaniella sp.]|nr:hypothetical protein [Duncaniella sp.]